MSCPYDVFCTGLGLYSRVTIEKGFDIGYYGGEQKFDSREEWEGGKVKTHARRTGDSCHILDGLPLRGWLRASGIRCGTYHKYSDQEEYKVDDITPTRERVSLEHGIGFMMNTSSSISHHNVKIVQRFPRGSLTPIHVMCTTKSISPGDELISSYQTNSQVVANFFFFFFSTQWHHQLQTT